MQAKLAAASLSTMWLASGASAAPILGASSDSIALSDSTTISFVVDTNDTTLAGLRLAFTALADGLTIEAVQSTDFAVTALGPTFDLGLSILYTGGGTNMPVWQATLQGDFLSTPRLPDTIITVGTVTVRGAAPGTSLVLTAEFTPLSGDAIIIGPSGVATVVPEPGTLALVALGVAALAITGRRRGA